MTIPKWLFPIVAIVAAVAVGVAAVLIGMRFAPLAPASAFVPPETETATVLAPIAIDDGDDGFDEDGDGDPADLAPDAGTEPGDDVAEGDEPLPSDEVGEREVAVAEEDPAASDSELLHLIDVVALSPDLLLGLLHLGLGDRDDDPCAPREGTPPGDCPAGAPGTVLFDDPLPPLWMNAQAWPRTHTELGDLPDRDLGELMCDSPEVPAGSASLRIRATAPGTWTVRYWPTDRPGDIHTAGPVVSSAQQTDDWSVEAHLEDGFYIAEHCLLLPEIDAGTAYTAVISGEDFFGRSPAAATVLFNGDGAPHHPMVTVQTVGQNLLLATVPHRADETVELRSLLVGPDTEVDCTQPDGATGLSPLTQVDHVAVAAAEQWRLNVTDDITEKAVVSFRVPEGATLLLCGRWFPGGDAPVWESTQATFESSLIVQSADRLLPRVEFIRFDARDGRAVALSMRVDTSEGLRCGSAEWSSGRDTDAVLCAAGALAGGTAGTADDRLFDRGFTGDLVLRVDGSISSGETSETTYLLPAGAGACVGTCGSPPPQVYRVATIGGTATIRVTWEQGLQNGRADWAVTSAVGRPLDYVVPDLPQIDGRAEWTFTEPGFYPTLTALMRLPVDRHVEWTLTTLNSYAPGEGMTCDAEPRPLTASGSSVDGIIAIRLDGVCLGASYIASLRLVDDAGNVAVWDLINRDTWWRTGAFLTVPSLDVTVRYRVDAFTSGGKYLQRFDLRMGFDTPLVNDYAVPLGSRCVADGGVIKSEGSFDSVLRASTAIGLRLKIVNRDYSHSPTCYPEPSDAPTEPALTDVSIRDLGSRDGVLLESTIDGVPTRVHIWVDRR